MINRKNLTLEEISDVLDIFNHESNRQKWSIPEGAFVSIEINGTLPFFITVEADITPVKTNMTKHAEKNNTGLKVESNFFH